MIGIRGFVSLLGLVCAATICLEAVAPKTASAAAAYTVYIYNTKRPSQGWFRAGLVGSVYTSYVNCRNSITSRVKENKKYKTDFEKFAIVLQNSYPPSGALRNYVTFRLVYDPPRGFLAATASESPTSLAVVNPEKCLIRSGANIPAFLDPEHDRVRRLVAISSSRGMRLATC